MSGRVSASEIRKSIAEALELLADPDEWVIITRHGRDVAGMVSMNLMNRILALEPAVKEHRAVIGVPDFCADRAPETKSGLTSAPATADADPLMRRIDSLRRSIGMPPLGPD